MKFASKLTVDDTTPSALYDTECNVPTDGGAVDAGPPLCTGCAPPSYSGFQANDGAGHEVYVEDFFFNTDHLPTLYVVFALWMVVTALFMVGWHTRLMNVLVWFLTLCFMNRNPNILNGGDDTLQVGLFLLLLSPSGCARSIDAWRRRRAGKAQRDENAGGEARQPHLATITSEALMTAIASSPTLRPRQPAASINCQAL